MYWFDSKSQDSGYLVASHWSTHICVNSALLLCYWFTVLYILDNFYFCFVIFHLYILNFFCCFTMSVNYKFVLFCPNFQLVNALTLIIYLLCSQSSHNLECEDLWVHYIKLLQKNLNGLTLSRVWPSVYGLHKYPYNPKSYSAMLILTYLYSVSNNLRVTLDKCS